MQSILSTLWNAVLGHPLDLVLLLIIGYQAWRIRMLKQDSASWYSAWLNKSQQLRATKQRAAKANARVRAAKG